ncbi:MAG: hypothetical protein Solivirus2_2 [Solivirus sp.]|uniref:Uncharacterized protein n=1 Tax=Solivirus sp. TaxID=2487772 RepID=A0A3G5AI02_9VIRU|nr:MAG: hypothetical protein Solivirus2_2 [Solivirus sp.]
MRTEVSNGEVIDKLSILEIKKSRITDEQKLKLIQEEIDSIRIVISDYEVKNSRIDSRSYNILKYVNEQIWWLSDKVREMKPEEKKSYAEIMHRIFKLNEMRYALKKKFDASSLIKEQKSYSSKPFVIRLPKDSSSIERVLGIIEFYSIVSDCKLLDSDEELNRALLPEEYLDLSKESLNEILRDLPEEIFHCHDLWSSFDSRSEETINFIVSGMLGDMIHSMYIPLLHYLKTGKKANIYITSDSKYGGEEFTMGVERTYADTKPLFLAQNYVASYSILDKEPKSYINLSAWRKSPFVYRTEWSFYLAQFYGLPRYPIATFNLPITVEYNDLVCIHMALPKRLHLKQVVDFPLEKIIKQNKCLFVSCNGAEYAHFASIYGEIIPCVLCSSLMEIATYISSCKFFIGNQSSPFAMAYSFRKPCLGSLTDPVFYSNHDMYPELFWWNSPERNYMRGIEKYIVYSI